jgi:amino acid transporter
MEQTDARDAPEVASGDDVDLERFGYSQKLNRTIGLFTSFCVSFSMVSVTTATFTLFGDPFTKTGGVGIWLWFPATIFGLVIAAVYGHLAARVPVTGYAYQWSSRLLSPHVGWFTGWFALCAFFAGTASIAVAIGSVFAGELFDDPTRGDVQLIGAVVVVVAVAFNAAGIKRATHVNNVGATTELIGTLGMAAAIAVGLIFFKDKAGVDILFDADPVGGGSIDLTVLGLAALLPVTTLLGWEGAADLAEETKDPRRVAPAAMLRAVALSGSVGCVIFAIFAAAIPHGPAALVNGSENPLFALFTQQIGTGFADAAKVVVFIAMFACLLANLTVATRMCYSLARDRMLPGWQALSTVNRTTRIPLNALLLVGVVAFGLNFVSAGIASRIFAIVAVMYYGTYLMTMVVARLARRRGTLGAAPPGYFDLGRALGPLTIVGALWCLVVIGYMTIPHVNHIAAEYSLGAVALGALQWVFLLRGRISRGEAGPPTATAEALRAAEHAESITAPRPAAPALEAASQDSTA